MKKIAIVLSILMAGVLSFAPAAAAAYVPPPVGLHVVSTTTTRATIAWTAPAAYRITGFYVNRNGFDTNGGGAYTSLRPATARYFTFTLLRPGTLYTLSVKTVTRYGSSVWAHTYARTLQARPTATANMVVGASDPGWSVPCEEYGAWSTCGTAWAWGTATVPGCDYNGECEGWVDLSALWGATFGCTDRYGRYHSEYNHVESGVADFGGYEGGNGWSGSGYGSEVWSLFQVPIYSCPIGYQKAQFGLHISHVTATISYYKAGEFHSFDASVAGDFYSPPRF